MRHTRIFLRLTTDGMAGSRTMRVSVKELLRNFSRLSDLALREPVIVTKNGRDRLVLVSFDAYTHPPADRPIPTERPESAHGVQRAE